MMTPSNDMTITVHALERMEERWPELTEGLDDLEIAHTIQGEVNDALVAGRRHQTCPIELANNNLARWRVEKDVWYVWNEDKTRGYVISDPLDDPDRSDRSQGITVMTTLVGQDPEVAKQKLKRR